MDLHNTWPERKGTVTKRAGSMRSTLHELQPRTLIFVWGGWSKSNQSRIWRPILEPPLASPTFRVHISTRLSGQSVIHFRGEIAMEPNYMSPEEWANTVGQLLAEQSKKSSSNKVTAEFTLTDDL